MLKTILASIVIVASGSAASAAVLDFTGLGSGNIGTNAASIAGANITSSADSLFVGAGGNGNSICALDSASFDCENDLEIDFVDDVENVMFDHGTWNAGDLVDIYIYDALDALAGIYTLNSAASVDLSGFGVIGRLFFDDQSTGGGTAYANINFDVVTSEVPLPASLPLLVGALGLIGAARRRRKA